MRTEFDKSQRQNKMVKKIMELMEEEQFTKGEAELLPESLRNALLKNSERIEKEQPFVVYREGTARRGYVPPMHVGQRIEVHRTCWGRKG